MPPTVTRAKRRQTRQLLLSCLQLPGDGRILSIQLRERHVDLLNGFCIIANHLLLSRLELLRDRRITVYCLLLASLELLDLLLHVRKTLSHPLKPLRNVGRNGGRRGFALPRYGLSVGYAL